MSPQRRTALVSVGAACLLVVIKLVAGLASSSLGLLAEAAHSGTDLAAALLTFFAVSVAVRPADRGHPYGHAKAQNLAALAEAGFLILVSVGIAVTAILRLAGVVEFDVDPTWWTFAAVALVLAIDASRTMVSLRGARLYRSDALFANALHFGSDFAGTIAVLAGLIVAALGVPAGDSIAALFVSGLVVAAAVRLASRNVDVLMDRSPEDETRIARRAIADARPARGAPTAQAAASGRRALRGRRHRRRPGRGDRPGPRCGGPRRRRPSRRACPGSTSSSTSNRRARMRRSASGCLPRRSPFRACARSTISRFSMSTGASRSLSTSSCPVSCRWTARTRSQSRSRLRSSLRSRRFVPCKPISSRSSETASGEEVDVDTAAIEAAVREETGVDPRELRFVRTDDGIVVFLTLGLPTAGSLADAHGQASAIEKRVRRAVPTIADVVVHTEP